VRERATQLLIAGAGCGGTAAALAAARLGLDVVVSEPTAWIGGQLTSQAVPPDEHPWIERFGCTASYRALRDGIRAFYRAHYPLTAEARARPALNPGAARVSAVAAEPRAVLAVLEAMLAPHRASGRVTVLLHHEPLAAEIDGDRIRSVTFRDAAGETVQVAARWVIDATETGELLPLCGAEHVTGAESQSQTGEPHAAAHADPLNMQPISVCFALDHLAGEDHAIPRPPSYERFRERFSLTAPDPKTLAPVHHTLTPNPDDDPAAAGPDLADERERDDELWTFRRVLARRNFAPGAFASDITVVNWPQIDYADGPAFDVPGADGHRRAARELSLCFLHWLQTEQGLPGLRLRGDVTGDMPDGLAMAPYIREARRIRAETTILEHGPVRYEDSVGIGAYRIDLHPSTGGDPYIDIPGRPFELPLGALVPLRLENLLAGGKNLGTTHITNGNRRLHPVEWNVGEAAAHTVAVAAAHATTPRAVRATPALLAELQASLVRAGAELRWPAVEPY
jgi:hypothetical protein